MRWIISVLSEKCFSWKVNFTFLTLSRLVCVSSLCRKVCFPCHSRFRDSTFYRTHNKLYLINDVKPIRPVTMTKPGGVETMSNVLVIVRKLYSYLSYLFCSRIKNQLLTPSDSSHPRALALYLSWVQKTQKLVTPPEIDLDHGKFYSVEYSWMDRIRVVIDYYCHYYYWYRFYSAVNIK